MGIIRILFLILIGILLYKIVKKIVSPSKQNPHVQGKVKNKSPFKKRNDIQDVDYEDIE